MRISDWSSDVCSSDLDGAQAAKADVRILRFRLAGGGEPLELAGAELNANAVLAQTPRGTLSLAVSDLVSGANRVDRLTPRVEGAQPGADFTLATEGEVTGADERRGGHGGARSCRYW